MRRLYELWGDLPPLFRWGSAATAGVVLGLIVVSGVWTILQRREAAARSAFVEVTATYRVAQSSPQDTSLAAAAQALGQFLTNHGGSAVAAEAQYFLGNVEAQRRSYDHAVRAFDEAARRGRGTVVTLSRLARAYSLEAKGDHGQALEAYEAARSRADPKEYPYAEALLGIARLQELLKEPAKAIEAYRRLLKDVPDAPQAADIRSRLALLGAT